MSADNEPSSDTIEGQWSAFKRYICEPYTENQEHLVALHRWYDDLYARRKSDGLELTYSEITHELTGRRFNAFCLNKQMYFSDDIAVLTLPYPRDIATAGVPSDRLVGVFLHDFEASDVNWKMTYQQGIEELNISAEHAVIKAHNDIIFGELKARLADAGLPDNERQHLSAQSNMRISKDLPLAGAPHHDILVREEKDRLLEPSWDRFIIHVLHGPGTNYFLGEDQNILVTVPTGTTSGHFAAHVNHPQNEEWGVLHEAARLPEGRAILTPINVVPSPIAGMLSRWRTKHYTPA